MNSTRFKLSALVTTGAAGGVDNGGGNRVEIRLHRTGRWTKDEHARFIEALRLYGKNWKMIKQYIKTRSGAQIRSHSQKFFKRLDDLEKSRPKQLQDMNAFAPLN